MIIADTCIPPNDNPQVVPDLMYGTVSSRKPLGSWSVFAPPWLQIFLGSLPLSGSIRYMFLTAELRVNAGNSQPMILLC